MPFRPRIPFLRPAGILAVFLRDPDVPYIVLRRPGIPGVLRPHPRIPCLPRFARVSVFPARFRIPRGQTHPPGRVSDGNPCSAVAPGRPWHPLILAGALEIRHTGSVESPGFVSVYPLGADRAAHRRHRPRFRRRTAYRCCRPCSGPPRNSCAVFPVRGSCHSPGFQGHPASGVGAVRHEPFRARRFFCLVRFRRFLRRYPGGIFRQFVFVVMPVAPPAAARRLVSFLVQSFLSVQNASSPLR